VDLSGVGKLLIIAGIVVVALGVLFLLTGRGVIPRLPGDLSFGRGHTRVYIPIGTSILLSVILTVLLNLFFWR
jgi:hypothetical protein